MIIVLDLDDTLYDERTYMTSGFYAVAKHLEVRFSIKADHTYSEMLAELEKSKTGVFNKVLAKHDLLSKKMIHECLMVYRKHKPNIRLYPDALRFLEENREVPIYIITDGNSLVQRLKIQALNLDLFVKRSYMTWKKGQAYAKPSPYFINLIAQNEGVKLEEIVYIGDNPEKDFVGIKKLGYKTVRILRGSYKNLNKDVDFEADIVVESFDQLRNIFENN